MRALNSWVRLAILYFFHNFSFATLQCFTFYLNQCCLPSSMKSTLKCILDGKATLHKMSSKYGGNLDIDTSGVRDDTKMSRDLTGMSQVTFTWEVENTLLSWHMLPLKWFFVKYFELCEHKDRSRPPQAFTFQERRSASIGSGIVRSRPGLSPAEILRRRGKMQNNFITIIIFR